MTLKRTLFYLVLASIMLALAACGAESPPPDTLPARTPRPTFTPTPLPPAANVAPPAVEAAAPPAPPAAAAAEAAAAAAIAVVNGELVNLRSAPSLTSDIVQVATRGAEFTVIGRSADDEWWQLCCVDDREVWVYESYVDTTGPVDAAPVREQAVAAPPAPTPIPPTPASVQATAPPAPTAPPADTPAAADTSLPALPFNLAGQEQFPETNNLVRIFAYVTSGDEPAAGYTLRVTRDSAELPAAGATAAEAGYTWPVANPRQRFQNLKVEFPNVSSAGVWTVQLVDGSGNPAGPPATFTLDATGTDREFYVRYDKP